MGAGYGFVVVKGEGVLADLCEDLGVRVQITEWSNSFCIWFYIVIQSQLALPALTLSFRIDLCN